MLELKIASTAGADLVEVPSVCRDVQLKGIAARITHEVEGSIIPGDVCRRWRDINRRSDVILRTNVRKAERHRW